LRIQVQRLFLKFLELRRHFSNWTIQSIIANSEERGGLYHFYNVFCFWFSNYPCEHVRVYISIYRIIVYPSILYELILHFVTCVLHSIYIIYPQLLRITGINNLFGRLKTSTTILKSRYTNENARRNVGDIQTYWVCRIMYLCITIYVSYSFVPRVIQSVVTFIIYV